VGGAGEAFGRFEYSPGNLRFSGVVKTFDL
jgi:hypothetical protein